MRTSLRRYVEWEGVVDITADQAVGAAAGGGDKKKQRGEQDKVQAFLRAVMKQSTAGSAGWHAGVVAKAAIEEEGARARHHGRQLKTARKKLGIAQAKQTGKGWGVWFGGWVWF